MVARVGSLESSRNKRNRYTSFFLRSGNGMENIFVFPFFLDRKSHFGKEKNIYIQIFSKRQKDFEVGPPRPLDSNSHQKNWWVPPSLQKVPTRNGEFWKEIFLPRYWRRIGWKDRSNFPLWAVPELENTLWFSNSCLQLGTNSFAGIVHGSRIGCQNGGANSDFLHSSWFWSVGLERKKELLFCQISGKNCCFARYLERYVFFARYLERYVFFARYLERYVFCLVLCALWLESCGVHLLPKWGSPLCFFTL